MELALESQIEALLFWQAEPQELKKMAVILKKSEEEVRVALGRLDRQLADRGLRLIAKDQRYTLGTAPELGQFFDQLAKEELSGELGRAGMETLAIVAYRAPVSKAEIDYIRGVNSGFTLRHLQIRGLIEKIPNPEDGRSPLYRLTFESMSLLGLSTIEQLPDYEKIKNQIDSFLNRDENENQPSKTNQ